MGIFVPVVDIPGNAATASQAVKLTNDSGSAPSYACRAWVNFNGAGTVAIRASGNVSSITDNGVGDFTINFATAMPDANYLMVCTSLDWSTAGPDSAGFPPYSTTSARLLTRNPSTANFLDRIFNGVAIFR